MIGKLRFLNANALKFLAAALMVVDHVGLLFFPYNLVFRAIGRISMPLFAFAVSEGCRYTKNKIRHFALIAGLAVICQLVYYFFDGSLYMLYFGYLFPFHFDDIRYAISQKDFVCQDSRVQARACRGNIYRRNRLYLSLLPNVYGRLRVLGLYAARIRGPVRFPRYRCARMDKADGRAPCARALFGDGLAHLLLTKRFLFACVVGNARRTDFTFI